MKTKKIISLIMAMILAICSFSISACADHAEEASVYHNHEIEYVFPEGTPDSVKEKIINGFEGDGETASTYGLTCTLFGHDTESTVIYTITHRKKATSPRCLKEYFNCTTCSRCDYFVSELISSQYIVCCAED